MLALLMASVPAAAEVDDGDADLKPTPEELARATVLKRWPDATDVLVTDAAGDEDDPEEEAEAPDHRRDEQPLETDALDGDAACGWTLSVTFVSGGHDFEVLLDDEGIPKFVYEDMPIESIPDDVLGAAYEAADEGDFVYCDKVLDETNDVPELTYVVGIGNEDIHLDSTGRVLHVDEANEELPAAEADNDDAI
jgi:hypothetical protein